MADVADVIDRWVRPLEDWPVVGVTFRDITPLLGDAAATAEVVAALAERVAAAGPVDVVAGVEARGFIVGALVAARLGVGFVPIRKAGKLPAEVVAATYDLEYGSATIEMHTDALAPGARVAVVDDVLATGGTLAAATELVGSVGATVVTTAVILEIGGLGGRRGLDPVPCITLRTYGGDL